MQIEEAVIFGINYEIALVLVVISLAVILFVTEKLSVDTVSIIAMALMMATGILTPEEGFSGFSNPATITVGAMFVISASLFKTGVLNGLGNLLIKTGRKSYFLCLITIMVSSGLLSAFINDTAVVALFMPLVLQVAKDTHISPAKLLMPLSFGALLGGICTLIGTSTNILVSGIAVRQGEEAFTMFEMTPVGVCLLTVGILYMIIWGQKKLPDRKLNEDIAEDFDLGEYLTELMIDSRFKDVGKQIAASDLAQLYRVKILDIKRKDGRSIKATGYTDILAGDTMTILCNVETLKKLSFQDGLEIKKERKFSEAGLSSNTGKLYEAIVTPNSVLDGKTLKQINFSVIYGAWVLAIRNRLGVIGEQVGRTKLRAGDVLLLLTTPNEVSSLKKSGDFLIISEKNSSEFRYKKSIPALLIIAGVIIISALKIAAIELSATIGVILLILFKVINVKEAYASIEWKVIFMLAGVLSMGAALEKTGAANVISNGIVYSLGTFGPHAVLSGVFFITFMSTNVMSNNATAALLAPIAIAIAQTMDLNSKPFLMAVAFAASLSFMSPIGYQTNTMIYGPGNYRFMDYVKIGTPLNLILWIIASILIPVVYPF